MSDTRALLSKISALKQRLEQVPPLPGEWPPGPHAPDKDDRLRRLEGELSAGAVYGALLDGNFRKLQKQLDGTEESVRLPAQLTARARRLLLLGGDLLSQLREQARHFRAELRAADE